VTSPPPSRPRGRTFQLALAFAALACAAPLWTVRILPFSDLPEQIAVIATFAHWGEPAWSGAYVLDIGKSQYLLYHLVGALLATVLGSAEHANLVLLSAVAIASPYAFRSLLRALDGDERLALFAVPVFWSRPLLMGFAPYVASVPVTAWALALAARQFAAPRRARAPALAGITVALFFLHVDPFLLFVLAACLMRSVLGVRDAIRGEGARAAAIASSAVATAKDLAWLAPGLLIAGAWALLGSLRGSVARRHVRFHGPAELLHEFPAWSADIWRSHIDEACSVVIWTAFALLVVQAGSRRRDRWKAALAAAPFVAAIALYAMLPYSIGPAVMLNVRIAVFVTLFAPLLIERVDGLAGAIPLGAVALATFTLAGDAAFELRRIEREDLGDVDRLLAHVRPSARVLTLPFHVTSPRVHWAPWTFIGSYARARRGGVSAFSFSEIPHWPLHFRPDAAPPRKALFWTFDACGYRNEIDGAYYDYVIARGNINPFRDAPPGPMFRRVDAEREFTLYERVPGATTPPWTVPDRGPCESRRSLELRDAAAVDLSE
jgi:hypothetical protein